MPNKKVLLIASDPRFFEDPENAYQVRGCDVFPVKDGTEALGLATQMHIDLIISQGVPGGVTPGQIQPALSDRTTMIVVPTPDTPRNVLRVYRKMDHVHVLEGPTKGKALLKLSSRLIAAPPRKYLSILVQVKVRGPKPTTVFSKSRDLSEGGLLIETNQRLLTHDRVGVSFLIPGADRMIQTEAVVVREGAQVGESRRYGLKFVELSEVEQIMIREFLQEKTAN